jgi:hypothetical protein
MFGNGTRLARLEQGQEVLAQGLAVVAESVMRSRSRPDLRTTRTIELKPLSYYTTTAIRDGIEELFRKTHFDICLFKKLLELARVYPPDDLMTHLDPLHCRDWSKMEPEYREQIQNHIIACFVPVDAAGQGGA